MLGRVPVARPIEAVISHLEHSTTGREKATRRHRPCQNLFSKDQHEISSHSCRRAFFDERKNARDKI
jgi:hypothetical protein